MTSVYHYEVHEVLPAGNGHRERSITHRSDYYEKPETAFTELNATLTAMKGDNGEFITPCPVDMMERQLAELANFTNTVLLADRTMQRLSITRVSAR